MKITTLYGLLFVLVFLVQGCKKPFNPKIITNSGGYLIVEGVISTGPDSTFIKLSRTVHISADTTTNPEQGATVSVENDQNVTYPLKEVTKGLYAAPNLSLDTTRKYRLRIQTIDNQQYLSDFESVKITPPIDSIGFNVTNDGMQVYVNTHDPKNNTRYYRWDYQETWNFTSRYHSGFVSDGTKIIRRVNDEELFSCFTGDTSSNIILGSSAKLSLDVINQNLITTISSGSEKIEKEYSILLRQYALTPDAYNFWTNLRKNSEQLGSIFDAQPSNINGNIHNISNPAVPAIGYVSVCSVASKRIFISKSQLPNTWLAIYPYYCLPDTFLYFNLHGFDEVAAYLVPLPTSRLVISELGEFEPPVGYLGAPRECIDCTIRGKVAPPAFWIYRN